MSEAHRNREGTCFRFRGNEMANLDAKRYGDYRHLERKAQVTKEEPEVGSLFCAPT